MDTVALLIAILAVVLGTLFSIVGVLGFIYSSLPWWSGSI
jgi:uncharacterized protein YybS (DUF2232 family)